MIRLPKDPRDLIKDKEFYQKDKNINFKSFLQLNYSEIEKLFLKMMSVAVYCLVKKDCTKIGRSKFCELRLKWCIVAGASDT